MQVSAAGIHNIHGPSSLSGVGGEWNTVQTGLQYIDYNITQNGMRVKIVTSARGSSILDIDGIKGAHFWSW